MKVERVTGIAAVAWQKQRLRQQTERLQNRYRTIYQPGRTAQILEYQRAKRAARLDKLMFKLTKITLWLSAGMLVWYLIKLQIRGWLF